jgi:copper resistance protein B
VELNVYGKDDATRGIGAGFSSAEAGLRLRYEIRRELAPYIGVTWARKFGETADLAELAGEEIDDSQLVVGIRAWF